MQSNQQTQHQMMGYDRAAVMFSPDGRLLQVEYARKMVRQGSTAIGMVCKDGVILVADKRLVEEITANDSLSVADETEEKGTRFEEFKQFVAPVVEKISEYRWWVVGGFMAIFVILLLLFHNLP